jgi:aldehyde:ferredoxin oxidoreductase
MDYTDRFLGGRGIAAKIYWDEMSPQTDALAPESRLILMTGPLAGFPGLSGSRWTVCGKSPVTDPELFCTCNLGGSWGSQLKLAGYDGIVVQGRAVKPVYLLVQDDNVELRNASALWGKGTFAVRDTLKAELGSSFRVVACGPAGENGVLYASLLADEDASGSGGFGAVMGSKNLKAIAVRGSNKPTAANPEVLRQLADTVREYTSGGPLPLTMILRGLAPGPNMKKQVCYGCSGNGCWRETYEASDGTKGKYMCGSSMFYQGLAYQYYGRPNEVPFLATKLCDDYGMDAFGIASAITWLRRCRRKGILTEEDTGIPISEKGSLDFIQALVKKIATREGFGDVLARGTARAADMVGDDSKKLLEGMITEYMIKAEEPPGGDPRLFSPIALFHAMEPRVARYQYAETIRPLSGWLAWVHGEEDAYVTSDVWRAVARDYLGGEIAADFSTYDGKALAAKMVQDRESAIASLILCIYVWPIMTVKNSESHVGDPALESKILSAVTGRDVDENGLRRIGEVIFNLERSIRVREGHRGRESDVLPEPYFTTPLETNVQDSECLVPGVNGEVISRKGEVVDRGEFKRMQDEYNMLRGWDVATGLQTRKKLEELGLDEVADDLEQRELIAVP